MLILCSRLRLSRPKDPWGTYSGLLGPAWPTACRADCLGASRRTAPPGAPNGSAFGHDLAINGQPPGHPALAASVMVNLPNVPICI